MKRLLYWAIGGSVFCLSCDRQSTSVVLLEPLQHTGIDFVNRVENRADFNFFSYRNFYNGGGVAIGDLNNDGLADVFFTANMGSNKLYLNKGNWQFDDISSRAGFHSKKKWSTGVVLADINQDGWLDIYVCNAGYQPGVGLEDELYINNNDLTFTESAAAYGLTDSTYTTHVSFFDYDLDGDLDCYRLNNSFIQPDKLNYANDRTLKAKDWLVDERYKGGGDQLLRNDNGKYTDVSDQAGIYGSLIGFGLGVTVGDVNNDHYPDMYISNDFFERDYLYINQRNGTFKEELEQWMQHISLSSMGADLADINNDGYADIFTTDMLPDDEYRLKTTATFENIDVHRLTTKKGFYHQYMQNALQINSGHGSFLETSRYSGVSASDWSWGALIFDMDNDGLNDIYVCNGIHHDVTDQDFIDFFANEVINKKTTATPEDQLALLKKMPSRPLLNKIFHNQGQLKFKDAGTEFGITTPSFSNGAAYGDLDNDGDLDLVVNNVNQAAFVFRNNANKLFKHHYIGVKLKGKEGNSFAVGSTVKVFTKGEVLTRELMPARGFQSSVDYKLIFGLGEKPVDSLLITWPDRTFTTIRNPPIDTVLNFQQGSQASAVAMPSELTITEMPLMIRVPASFDKHAEDDFVDFYYERNIPMMLSRQGPKAAHGDVNGDGLEDLYIGGASGQGGQLYIQSSQGFVKKDQPAFKTFVASEDDAVMFFDADNDRDLDLFVGSGGNNHPSGSKEMQNRLFMNDGKGNFVFSSGSLPASRGNTSVVLANDFDGDGDLDLFVGSRCDPRQYGTTSTSYLLLNDGSGKFTDIAKGRNPDIANIGMVTSAAYANIGGDAHPELIIVGEWMEPRIFSWSRDHFKEVMTTMGGLSGWWQSLQVADMDGDGDNDLVLGNFGENFYLYPGPQSPVKLWVNDFDGNGVTDKIFTRTVNGRDVTVFMKREVTDQLPLLKKQVLQHEDFAKKSMQELFSKELLDKSKVRIFNTASSGIAYNDGSGRFRFSPFPMEIQWSSVNAIHCIDFNGDGLKDLVLGGNNFNFLPQFGRLDASMGHVLINKGKGQFELLSNQRSGMQLRGQVRDIKEIVIRGNRHLLVLQNDEQPLLYRVQPQ